MPERAAVDSEADEFEPEAAASDTVEHVDIGEIRDRVEVRDDPGEALLTPVGCVEADCASRRRNQLIHRCSIATGGPVAAADEGMHRRPVDAIPIVVENEPVGEKVQHASILPAGAACRSGTVEVVNRIGIMLGVALPLAAVDLLVKSSRPTEAWAYHERSFGWLLLSIALLAGMVFIVRVPSLPVAAAAGVLSGGVLGNSLSAAWNEMSVPNPFIVVSGRSVIAFNLADIWVLVGIVLLVLGLGAWLVRNRDLIQSPRDVTRRAEALSDVPSADNS